MERITLLENEVLVQKCDRLEIWLNEAGIVQKENGNFSWFVGDFLPFGNENYSTGCVPTLDEAMRALVRTAMS
jgi:hypothetical protein